MARKSRKIRKIAVDEGTMAIAYKMLQASDSLVVRSMEEGTKVSPAVSDFRKELGLIIRKQSDSLPDVPDELVMEFNYLLK